MKHFVVKVKDQDLFFNADEMMGEFICEAPMLLNKFQADDIMKYCPDEIFHLDEDKYFSKKDLEIRQVELNFI